MITSDSITKFAPAFLAAQKQMTHAIKDANNPHFKSKYANLPGVIEAVKEALNTHGITFTQSASPSDGISLNLTTRLLHESGEWIEDTAPCPLPKQDPQGFGSAMTYMRRYCLAAICGIAQDDDDGNAASGLSNQNQKQSARPSQPKNGSHPTTEDPQEQVKRERAIAACDEILRSLPEPSQADAVMHMKSSYDIDKLAKLPYPQLLDFYKWLNATFPAQQAA